MLVIGTALGSVVFPTKIGTSTEIIASLSATTIFITRIVTAVVNTTSTYFTCSDTGGIGCPHFFNLTYIASVNYRGAWGLSYQGYLGDNTSVPPIEVGNFYGHGSTNESIMVSGTDTYGITVCVEAQKLDASNSMLVLRIFPPTNVSNQTSLPYGTTESCLTDVIM